MLRRFLISLIIAAVQSVPCCSELVACSDVYYGHDALRFRSDDQLLWSPKGEFLFELRRALPKVDSRFKAQSPTSDRGTGRITVDSSLADLKAAMKNSGKSEAGREEVIANYKGVREEILSYHNQVESYRRRLRWKSAQERKQIKAPEFKAPKIPAGLPREFDLYLRGALAWREGDVQTARKQWGAALQLPVEQRKYRSVWAAYMLGRSYVGDDPEQAVKWFVLTRRMVAEGFRDSTGLAAASLGWQGRVELDRGDRLAAIKLYVDQLATGDASAAASLCICASSVLKAGGRELDKAAGDELARGVITAYLAAGPSALWIASGETAKEHVQAWLEALERCDARDLPGAGRLGWAAYRTGLMAQCKRWVDRAPEDDVIACWIRAKLLLRAGKIDQAAGQLAAALKVPESTGQDEDERLYKTRVMNSVATDLASLRLHWRQYVAALHLLATHDHHHEAAYLAERVLTIDELITYVNAKRKEPHIPPVSDTLARRLVRVGRWKESRAYFAPEMRTVLDAYIAAIRKGHDSKIDKAERAEAFWTAAVMARKWGRKLMGYSTGWYGAEPDGTFHPWPESVRPSANNGFAVAPGVQDELYRVSLHRPTPVKRWHYLYESVDHAWRACQLMPDNDELTARRICEAGTWIKYRDPEAADRFYKALVGRCGNTSLGKEAARLRWLPQIPSDTNE